MTLRHRDITGVLEVLGDVAGADDLETYAERAVRGLLRLIPTDHGHAFNELRQEPFVLAFTFEEPDTVGVPDAEEVLAALWRTSPTATPHVGTGGGVYRWSDLRTPAELDALDVYQLAFAAAGMRHITKVVFPSGPLVSDAFMLGRTHDDFSDRDVEILRTLYPHLLAMHRAVHARERSRTLERAMLDQDRGVVVLRHGRVEALLGGASALLARWSRAGDQMPPNVRDWIVNQARRRLPAEAQVAIEPLVIGSNGRRLVLSYLPATDADLESQVLLEERDSGDRTSTFGLTPRETEVLRRVGEGSTNREVAEALHIAPTTVRRHLENIFAKLDVTTRTAAVARAFPQQPS